ncbi:c-type cytochrome [Minwuia sp.]|uniref:c-type cytochrome n=1 Tax=Minwuia sp. TaxID=2493630 RepID=UPI003A8FA63C
MRIVAILILVAVAASTAAAIWWLRQPQTAATSNNGGRLAHQVDVIVPALSEMAQAGQETFTAKCQMCHGANASGGPGGPPLVHIIYEPSHHGDGAFLAAIRAGVRQHHWRFGNMPPVPGVTDEQIPQIIAYIRELQRANGIE